MENTAALLFDYLKNILYHPDKAELDISRLPPDFRKLGQGLQYFAECVRELREFMLAMAKGDLSHEAPGISNALAGPAKELQGNLRHLAWQAAQIAKGDYSQRVDFMGDFSEAFNTMARQLAVRTEGLVRERRLVEEANADLKQMLDLVLTLVNNTTSMIFTLAADSGEKIFFNKTAEWFIKAKPQIAKALLSALRAKEIDSRSASVIWDASFDSGSGETVYYNIESFQIRWHNKAAVVHSAFDDTDRKRRENIVRDMAYCDPLTGLNNRRYAMNLMEDWIRRKVAFLLSFIDVDYLKYCNDVHGHVCGDEYLLELTSLFKTLECEVCRVGGDEFFILSPGSGMTARNAELTRLRELLITQNTAPYPKSFSFATVAVPVSPTMPLQKYINITDSLMYQYKLQYKKPLSDVLYKDDRA